MVVCFTLWRVAGTAPVADRLPRPQCGSSFVHLAIVIFVFILHRDNIYKVRRLCRALTATCKIVLKIWDSTVFYQFSAWMLAYRPRVMFLRNILCCYKYSIYMHRCEEELRRQSFLYGHALRSPARRRCRRQPTATCQFLCTIN